MPTSKTKVGRMLRERADSYSTDAAALFANGFCDDVVLYWAIRDELRKIADQIEADA